MHGHAGETEEGNDEPHSDAGPMHTTSTVSPPRAEMAAAADANSVSSGSRSRAARDDAVGAKKGRGDGQEYHEGSEGSGSESSGSEAEVALLQAMIYGKKAPVEERSAMRKNAAEPTPARSHEEGRDATVEREPIVSRLADDAARLDARAVHRKHVGGAEVGRAGSTRPPSGPSMAVATAPGPRGRQQGATPVDLAALGSEIEELSRLEAALTQRGRRSMPEVEGDKYGPGQHRESQLRGLLGNARGGPQETERVYHEGDGSMGADGLAEFAARSDVSSQPGKPAGGSTKSTGKNKEKDRGKGKGVSGSLKSLRRKMRSSRGSEEMEPVVANPFANMPTIAQERAKMPENC